VNKRAISLPDDNMRMFVGLDVHKKYTEVAVVDEEGVVEKQERIENEPGRIEEFSNGLGNATMVLESSSSWFWLYEILSRKHRSIDAMFLQAFYGVKVRLVNPDGNDE
jgi:transposase